MRANALAACAPRFRDSHTDRMLQNYHLIQLFLQRERFATNGLEKVTEI